jgi:hypothetical protein
VSWQHAAHDTPERGNAQRRVVLEDCRRFRRSGLLRNVVRGPYVGPRAPQFASALLRHFEAAEAIRWGFFISDESGPELKFAWNRWNWMHGPVRNDAASGHSVRLTVPKFMPLEPLPFSTVKSGPGKPELIACPHRCESTD